MIYEIAITPRAYECLGHCFEEFDGITELDRLIFGEETSFNSVFLTADRHDSWISEVEKVVERLPVQSRSRAMRLMQQLRATMRGRVLDELGAEDVFVSYIRSDKQLVRLLGSELAKIVGHEGLLVASDATEDQSRAWDVMNIGNRDWRQQHFARSLDVPRTKEGQDAIFKRLGEFATTLYLSLPYLNTEWATVGQLVNVIREIAERKKRLMKIVVIAANFGEAEIQKHMGKAMSEIPRSNQYLQVKGYASKGGFLGRRILAELEPSLNSGKKILWGLAAEHVWVGEKGRKLLGSNPWSVLTSKDAAHEFRTHFQPVICGSSCFDYPACS